MDKNIEVNTYIYIYSLNATTEATVTFPSGKDVSQQCFQEVGLHKRRYLSLIRHNNSKQQNYSHTSFYFFLCYKGMIYYEVLDHADMCRQLSAKVSTVKFL